MSGIHANFGAAGDDVIGTSQTGGINGATCNFWVNPTNSGQTHSELAGGARVAATRYGVLTLSDHVHPVNK